jgi:hypothetical protein
MAITVNTATIKNLDMSALGVMHSFAWTPHDANYLEDPNFVGVQVVSKGISFAAEGDITYVNVEGKTCVIPSGMLAAGMIHPIRGIVKIDNTGTTETSIQIYY